MDDIQKSLLETFRAESKELLAELESSLLELENCPDDQDIVGRVFRVLHTIKGNGAMFGFEAISAFTHDLESIYDLVRTGRLAVTHELIDLTLGARDVISGMLDDPRGTGGTRGEEAEGILMELRQLTGVGEAGKSQKTEVMAAPLPGAPSPGSTEKTYRVRFRPNRDLFLSGTNPLLLMRELCGLGQHTVVPNLTTIPSLEEYEPGGCYTSWDVILTTDRDVNAIRDVFIFIEDRCSLDIDVIDEEGGADTETEHRRLGEILINRGDIDHEDLAQALTGRFPLGKELVERRVVDQHAVESALVEQKVLSKIRQKRREEEAATSVRVASEKLDSLVDLVGEMVTVQARLTQTATQLADTDLLLVAEQVERLTWELRDSAFSIRMVPIGTTFSTFRRLVRDLSGEMGRQVDLVAEGAETELDKTVIEKLKDPLVHLIRNSIDHGIEPPEVREAAGKPRTGTIRLSATQAGSDVLIRVADDGAGLDEEAIRAKAVEKGLLPADSTLTGEKLYNLIFLPSFTTAGKVTAVSGRGVGMDVVKKSVEALRGSIEVASRRGAGTSITVRLPLTLAIIEGLQVAIGREKFIFPLTAVEEVIELTRRDAREFHGRHLTKVRGEVVPYIRLRELFGMEGELPSIEQIVITDHTSGRLGFVVDRVVGEHSTVIKPLGRAFRNVDGMSGATILGDGTVALILDVSRLERMAAEEERKTLGSVAY